MALSREAYKEKLVGHSCRETGWNTNDGNRENVSRPKGGAEETGAANFKERHQSARRKEAARKTPRPVAVRLTIVTGAAIIGPRPAGRAGRPRPTAARAGAGGRSRSPPRRLLSSRRPCRAGRGRGRRRRRAPAPGGRRSSPRPSGQGGRRGL